MLGGGGNGLTYALFPKKSRGRSGEKGYKQESIRIINEFLQSEDTEIIRNRYMAF